MATQPNEHSLVGKMRERAEPVERARPRRTMFAVTAATAKTLKTFGMCPASLLRRSQRARALGVDVYTGQRAVPRPAAHSFELAFGGI